MQVADPMRLGTTYCARPLRAFCVARAKLKGADDAEVTNQTQHKTAARSYRSALLDYVRQHNAVQKLGL